MNEMNEKYVPIFVITDGNWYILRKIFMIFSNLSQMRYIQLWDLSHCNCSLIPEDRGLITSGLDDLSLSV